MNYLTITDTAILIGYSNSGACVYSAMLSLTRYWDGEHVWDNDSLVRELELHRVRGQLFDESGVLFQEFESTFDTTTGMYASGWARDSDGVLAEHSA